MFENKPTFSMSILFCYKTKNIIENCNCIISLQIMVLKTGQPENFFQKRPYPIKFFATQTS